MEMLWIGGYCRIEFRFACDFRPLICAMGAEEVRAREIGDLRRKEREITGP